MESRGMMLKSDAQTLAFLYKPRFLLFRTTRDIYLVNVRVVVTVKNLFNTPKYFIVSKAIPIQGKATVHMGEITLDTS